jgi:DNA-binding winged helix-turn-helix (wHTH) protein
MKSPDNTTLRIGACRVDTSLDEISKDGKIVKLEPRAMRLLVCLTEHAGQVVSDDSKHGSYIANVPRRGYRLVAPVVPWLDPTRVSEARSTYLPIAATTTYIATTTGAFFGRYGIVLSIALAAALGYFVARSTSPTAWPKKSPTCWPRFPA